jgi:uncharacterized tellurite resistance protein B-like protein
MAKDFTKYSIEGIAQGLGKARLVQKIIEDYTVKHNLNFDELQKVWFDDLQGGRGVFRKLSDIDEKDAARFYIDAPISLNDGTQIAVCNQWGKHNVANFILQAGLNGYVIKAESDEAKEEIASDNSSSDDSILAHANMLLGWNLLDITWHVPHALAFLIRHVIIADGEIIEGELNWMQVAFEEYDEQGIEVRAVWDDVDNKAQMYWNIGTYDMLLPNSINYLNENLDFNQKARLIQILMQICAEDDIIKKDEYVTLMLIAKIFFPGQEHEGVTNVFKEMGIKIEE